MSKCRVVIYAQAMVFQKTGRVVQETVNVAGMIVPQQVEEEQEFECEQIATEFKGTSISEKDLTERLRQISAGVRKSMIDKGLVQ